MTIKERIDFAINRMKTVGWCQGAFRKNAQPSECGCAHGSLVQDSEYYGTWPEEVEQARAIIDRQLRSSPGPHRSLTGWNDVHGRTVEEVIALFEEVRAVLEQEAIPPPTD